MLVGKHQSIMEGLWSRSWIGPLAAVSSIGVMSGRAGWEDPSPES